MVEAPGIARNIISLRKIVNSGIKVNLSKEGIKLIAGSDKVITEGVYDTRFWYLNFEESRVLSDKLPSTLVFKHIFRYLSGTKDLSLKYTGKSDKLECFVDASLGRNCEFGKSTTGLIITLFGDVIFWRTKKQTHVALSTMEAEYIAMSLAAKKLVCIREMCKRILKIDKLLHCHQGEVFGMLSKV